MTPTRDHKRRWLRALGGADPPSTVSIRGRVFHHEETFKHDFFAATAVYGGAAGRVVLKAGRTAPLFGIPMDWVGAFLAQREAAMYRVLGHVAGVPKFMGFWGRTGILHACVEGRPLSKGMRVDDAFFPELRAMLDEIHRRGAAFVDLEKPENILVGDDGRPYLFDFQISWCLPPNRLGDCWPARVILHGLQAADHYHLLKHQRRFRPDQLTESELRRSREPPPWISMHRRLFRPVTQLRRRLLVWLGARQTHRGRSPG